MFTVCLYFFLPPLSAHLRYDSTGFLSTYVKFMTTPGSHNDTYAESFHRDFFSNWANGVPPEQCSKGTEGHNTAQIGGFVMLPPVILSQLGKGAENAKFMALKHLKLTHESRKLAGFAEVGRSLILHHRTTSAPPLSSCIDIKTILKPSGKGVVAKLVSW